MNHTPFVLPRFNPESPGKLELYISGISQGDVKAFMECRHISLTPLGMEGVNAIKLSGNYEILIEECSAFPELSELIRFAFKKISERFNRRISFMGKRLDTGFPVIMGVLNVTPDSFSDGGLYFSKEEAVQKGIEIEKEGAHIIDIGGESTRPGAEAVSEEEEKRRVIPVIRELSGILTIPISVDTMKPSVAKEAVAAGASIINDVGGFSLPEMRKVAAEYDCGAVIMHMRGTPRTMQINPQYTDVLFEVAYFLNEQMKKCRSEGMREESMVLDPGIGFGKRMEHNILLIRHLLSLQSLGRPVLVGASRKSFIATLTKDPGKKRLEGSLSAAVTAYLNGADILRVHDVSETKKALSVAAAVMRSHIPVE